MQATLDERVRSLASAQHGVFHVGQLDPAVATTSACKHRRATGSWQWIFDRVYRVAGAPRSWEADVLASCFAAGSRALASRRTAAQLWELPGGKRQPIEITCPRWRRAQVPAFLVHETKVLEDVDRACVRAIPVTSVARTILDLGAVCGPRTVELAVDNALRRELTSLAELRKTVDRLSRSGRNGVGVLRNVLELRGHRAPTASEMESLLLAVLAANGLPTPIVQFTVLSDRVEFLGTVDAAYPDAKIAIEYESYQHHIGREALVRDSARRNRLIESGWIVITATAVDLQTGGHDLCRAIRASLVLRAPDFGVNAGRDGGPQ